MNAFKRFFKTKYNKAVTAVSFCLLQLSVMPNMIVHADFTGDLKQPPKLNVTGGGNNQVSATATENGQKVTTTAVLNQYLAESRKWVLMVYGIAILLCLAAFTFNALKLANSADTPPARHQAVVGMEVTFIAMAILGAISWILGLAYNFI